MCLYQPVPESTFLAEGIDEECPGRVEIHHRSGTGLVGRPWGQSSTVGVAGGSESDPRPMHGDCQVVRGSGPDEDLALFGLFPFKDEWEIQSMTGTEAPAQHWGAPGEQVGPDGAGVAELGFGQPDGRNGEHLIGFDRAEQVAHLSLIHISGKRNHFLRRTTFINQVDATRLPPYDLPTACL